MNLLTNPIVLRALVVFFGAMLLFIIGVLLIRELRKRFTEDIQFKEPRSDDTGFALAAYQGVIQRLKEQEQELRRLREEATAKASATGNLSAAILSNLASGVVLFNPACLVQQANEAAKRIIGFASPSGLHARDLFRGVSAIRRESGEEIEVSALVAAIEGAEQGDALSHFRRAEMDYTSPAGESRVLGVTLSPVMSGAGQRIGVACLVSDLTEITRLSRQMRTSESLAALGEMSAGIAHEFKNSLATISGYAQMIAQGEPGTVRDFGERIVRETSNLNRVVMDFLQFARPGEMRTASVELASLIDECAIEARVKLEPEIPAATMLRGDPTALRQAFSNLLRNSAEAARDGVPVRVSARASERNGMVEIELKDDGKGIPADDLAKIFIPFFTTKTQGTGLGLALVHRIVNQHGGSIRAASDESGTTFTLVLPAAK